MMLDRIQLPQVAKLGIILFLGFTIGFIIFSQLASNDHDNHHELREAKGDFLMSSEPLSVKAGGLGKIREKDDEVVEAVNQIKQEFEAKTGKQYESIEVIHYSPQTVAGKNYFVKARVTEVGGNAMIAHLRIFLNLSRQYELTAYQLDKKEEDQLVYFQ